MLMTMLTLLAVASGSAASKGSQPFEITNNKPFLPVSVNGSAPQWFILDTGNNTTSILARECADRLKIARSNDARADVGGGMGVDVRTSQAAEAMSLRVFGETLRVAEPIVLTLGHVSRTEGRHVDGLLGNDFMSQHVVELDYAQRRITLRDPAGFVPPKDAIIVPLDLETGWPIVDGTVTPKGGKPIRCRMIVDTGMRGTVTLFRPFAAKHGLHDSPTRLANRVIGAGAGGLMRGDVDRLDALSFGPITFTAPVATYSRDTTGVFTLDYPEAIVGGEFLQRYRVTFDYSRARMLLEPAGVTTSFEHDMSGVFLSSEGTNHETIRIVWVNDATPAAAAGLQVDDEIVAIDGERTPKLTLDEARARLRVPGSRRLEIRRGGRLLQVGLEARRLI